MKSSTPIAVALVLTGCATGRTAQLEARIHTLEQQVSALRMAQRAPASPPGCRQVLDSSVPTTTSFSFTLNVVMGRSEFHRGDSIVVNEVLGTSPDFTVGGMYLVRGTYTLESAPNAELGFHATAIHPGEGCTDGNGRDEQLISRGSGHFEMALRLAYEGRPHVSFSVNHQEVGGVYFATQTEAPRESSGMMLELQ